MTIQRIDSFCLSYPEPHYRGALRCVTLVRVEESGGTVGWGEAISQFPEATKATKLLIDEGFAPMLIGEDALDVERHWRAMCRHAYWYGVEGIAAFAISALDMALWDLKGKILGQPVAKLLGGQLRDAIPAMGSIIFDMDDLDWTLREFAWMKDRGYRIVKAGWGMTPQSLFGHDAEKDLRYVAAVRETIGQEIGLVVDVPGAQNLWDVPTAIRRANALEAFDLRWIEQPLLPSNLAGYSRLRAAIATPIGAGEDEWGPESYRCVIEAGAVDVLQLDPGRCLGLTGCRTVVMMAEAAGMKCSAHSWSSALNTAASLAFLAMSPACDTLDFKPHESPMQHDLVDDPWSAEAGLLTLRTTPGLGVSVRQEAVDRYSF